MSLVKPITPHLWYDTQAKEAAEFYCSVFPDSRIETSTRLRNTPSGDCDLLYFKLCGQPFMAISAGPIFKFNPSISFIVNFDPSRDAQAVYYAKQGAPPVHVERHHRCLWHSPLARVG